MKKALIITALLVMTVSNTTYAAGEFEGVKGSNLTTSVKSFAKEFPLGLSSQQMLTELGMPRNHKTAFGVETATYKFGQASAIEFYINKEGKIFDCMAYPQDPGQGTNDANVSAKGTMAIFSAFNSDNKSIWNMEAVKCSELKH
jgi:hypothetical protein